MPDTPDIAPLKAPLPEPAPPKVPEPTKRYHQNIPRYLLDLDAPEESSRCRRANETTLNLPTPPTLPGFLGKSILNGVTPHKDDSSVLIMPNHTVLNHLATSSIKDGILATSATTRYKQKVCTCLWRGVPRGSSANACDSSSPRSCTSQRRKISIDIEGLGRWEEEELASAIFVRVGSAEHEFASREVLVVDVMKVFVFYVNTPFILDLWRRPCMRRKEISWCECMEGRRSKA